MVACPKPRPKLLDKRDKHAGVAKQDRAEREKCRQRSGGQCEAWVYDRALHRDNTHEQWFCIPGRRCIRRSSQNHHLIGGSGRRNKGRSVLAAHRIDVCDRCHDEITNHVLVPVGGTLKEDAATVKYERVR